MLANLSSVGLEWLDGLTTQGLAWISRRREDTTGVVIHTSDQAGETFDRIVWLGASRSAVRQMTCRQGGPLRQYVTTVCDPSVLPLPDIARLSARRWDIERAFLILKREVGLHLIWSSNVTVVLFHMWAALIVAHVIHAIREVALRKGVYAFAQCPSWCRTGCSGVPAPFGPRTATTSPGSIVRPMSLRAWTLP